MMLKQKSKSWGRIKYFSIFILLLACQISGFAQVRSSQGELSETEVSKSSSNSGNNYVNKKDAILGKDEIRIRYSKPPLIIVDGAAVDFYDFLNQPPRTKDVRILDASMATELYGETGKYGAWIFFEKVKEIDYNIFIE